MQTFNMKSVNMKKHKIALHPRRMPKQARTYSAIHPGKDTNCNEVFDGSWPDSESITFEKHGLVEASW